MTQSSFSELEDLRPGQKIYLNHYAPPFFLAYLLYFLDQKGPHIVVSKSSSQLEQIQQGLLFFEKRAKVFFMEEPCLEKLSKKALLRALSAVKSDVFMTSPKGLAQQLPQPEDFQKSFLSLKPGDHLPAPPDEWLKSLHYKPAQKAGKPGEFCFKGALCDIFPPSLEEPVRLELIGPEVQAIKTLDEQKPGGLVKEVFIGPAEAEAKASHKILDYFKSSDPLLWLLDEEGIKALGKNSTRQVVFAPEGGKKPALNFSFSVLKKDFLSPPGVLKRLKTRSAFVFISVDSESVFFPDVEEKVVVKKESLWPEMLREQRENKYLVHSIHKPLRDSCRFVFEGEEFYFLKNLKPKKLNFQHPGAGVLSFAELKVGDLAAHRQHGLGLYQGLKLLQFNGAVQEFCTLKYKDGDLLYVPVYAVGELQKYIGGLNVDFLDKLGGLRWEKAKNRAKKYLQNQTIEWIELYNKRQKTLRKPFSLPGPDFKQFAGEFLFSETEDQKKAIQEILHDLIQKKHPMDRLICGEAGYGKTEIALRAVFKVLEDGFQACVLAPTTLLSFQHFERFKERFSPHPFRLAVLNRFTSTREKKKILEEIKNGSLDILIGTHKILSPQVFFKNLGLMVIDEEHLFGVRAKEKLKKWHSKLDTLSLSATPIPRSLNLSLSGVKDISFVNTPPSGRQPIKTFIDSFKKELVRSAILKELKREGQVIFMHNRIFDLEQIKDELKLAVPTARYGLAHGKMKDLQKEVVLDFFHRKFDVLVCTTIVESGMDFPLAGTLFINNADELGLSQLYQIRGRIGRSSREGYCWLLTKPGRKINAQALERLKIIQENNQAGAGLAVAKYDLEMRGAGNLMGAEQSGFLHSLGFEMYFELLKSSIEKTENLTPPAPEIHFNIPAYLPEQYIPQEKLRLIFYKKFSTAGKESDFAGLTEELENFYGPLPETARNFVQISCIKFWAKKWHIRELSYKNSWLSVSFSDSTPLKPDFLLKSLKEGICEYQRKNTFRFFIKKDILRNVLKLIKNFKTGSMQCRNINIET